MLPRFCFFYGPGQERYNLFVFCLFVSYFIFLFSAFPFCIIFKVFGHALLVSFLPLFCCLFPLRLLCRFRLLSLFLPPFPLGFINAFHERLRLAMALNLCFSFLFFSFFFCFFFCFFFLKIPGILTDTERWRRFLVCLFSISREYYCFLFHLFFIFGTRGERARERARERRRKKRSLRWVITPVLFPDVCHW